MEHEASGQMSPPKKTCFWGSASSKFVFPDWACVKFRQQRFLEHCDEAKPPWGSWAILLFKVWTGAAFICHCILHRSVCSSLCVALFHSVLLTLWFWWPKTWMSVLLECICHHLTFFICFLSLYPENRVKDPKVAILNVSCYANESFCALLNAITGIIWFFMRVFEVEEISVSHCRKTHNWGAQ